MVTSLKQNKNKIEKRIKLIHILKGNMSTSISFHSINILQLFTIAIYKNSNMLNFFSTCYRGESGIKVNGICHLPTTSSLEQLRRSEVWGVRLLKWRPLDQSTQLFCFPLLCRKSLQDIHNLFLDAKIIFLSKVMVKNQRRIKINQAS